MNEDRKNKWSQPLSGFAFMMDLSRVPKEKRLDVIRRLQSCQRPIVPMTVEGYTK
jgi:hypothetical protein